MILSSLLCQKNKHNQRHALDSLMVHSKCVAMLAGSDESGTKSYEEFLQIGERECNSNLMQQVYRSNIGVHCWFREYEAAANLAEKYRCVPKSTVDFFHVFFEGIAAFWLMRNAKQGRWRNMGEKALKKMSQLAQHSRWNFENKVFLLKAELHYLNGDLNLAELAYESSIVSARDHKFIHEEALAHELYGFFCLENHFVSKAMEQLTLAYEKYIKWGAFKKADDMKRITSCLGLQLLQEQNYPV